MRIIPGHTSKKGFTLIELVVTLCIAGIFSTFAMEYYLQAVKANRAAAEKDQSYFEYNKNKNIMKKTLIDNRGECVDGIYRFVGENADSLNTTVPFPELKCSPIPHGRTLVYYLGPLNSAMKTPVGFSTVLE